MGKSLNGSPWGPVERFYTSGSDTPTPREGDEPATDPPGGRLVLVLVFFTPWCFGLGMLAGHYLGR